MDFKMFKLELLIELRKASQGLFDIQSDGDDFIAFEPTRRQKFCALKISQLEPEFLAGNLSDIPGIAADMAESLKNRIKRDFGEDFFYARCKTLGLN